MDRLTKFASKLYPRWWRQRYGEEFAALLEDVRPGPGGTLDVLKGALTMQLSTTSSVKTLFTCTIAGVVLGIGSTFFFTPQYSSNAVVRVQGPEGTTQVDIVDTINRYASGVLSRVELTNLIRNLNLYPDERQKMPNEDLLEMMKRDIRIKAAPVITGSRKDTGFEVSFQYPDRVVAQRVVNRLVSGFLDVNIQAADRAGKPGPTLRMLDPASLPANPIFPLRKVFAVAGLGGGLLLGGLLSFVLYVRRRRQAA